MFTKKSDRDCTLGAVGLNMEAPDPSQPLPIELELQAQDRDAFFTKLEDVSMEANTSLASVDATTEVMGQDLDSTRTQASLLDATYHVAAVLQASLQATSTGLQQVSSYPSPLPPPAQPLLKPIHPNPICRFLPMPRLRMACYWIV